MVLASANSFIPPHPNSLWRTKRRRCYYAFVIEDRKFAILFAATILAARKLSELELKESRGLCPTREIIITDAISKAEEIMKKIEKNYPAK